MQKKVGRCEQPLKVYCFIGSTENGIKLQPIPQSDGLFTSSSVTDFAK